MSAARSHTKSRVLKPDDLVPADLAVGPVPGEALGPDADERRGSSHEQDRVATPSRVVRKTGGAVRRATDIVLGDFGEHPVASAGGYDAGRRHGSSQSTTEDASHRESRMGENAPSEEQIYAEIRQSVEQDLIAVFEARATAEAAEHERRLTELQDRYEEEINQAATAVSALLEGWATAATRFFEDAERDLVALAVDVAGAITDRPLTDAETTTVAHSLGWAIERLAGDGPMDVRVSPALLERLQALDIMPDADAQHQIRWHVDKELDEGDYVALTATASIRAVRAEAIERARKQLLAHARPVDAEDVDDADDRDK